MKEIVNWSIGDRGTHKGRKCSIINTHSKWVEGVYTLVSLEIEYDDDNSRLKINANELQDTLRFRWVSDGWNHGYSWCKLYGLSITQLVDMMDEKDPEINKYMNIQEEKDGAISFYAYRISPEEVVNDFRKYNNVFVFANWHWDGDVFSCTDDSNLTCEFVNGPEQGDEEDWIIADIKITAKDGEYVFEIGAGDFTEEEINVYNKWRNANEKSN